MTSSNLRQKFLDFFEKRGHKIVPSSSLIPNDSSVLFTTAGMQQFKPYFLGEKSPYGDKAVSCQKCLRTSDIDKAGDESHLTFFEMLGNFSFGSYFKKETIELALEFLIKNCRLSEDRLWFTYFKGDSRIPEDSESKQILLKLGIPENKIIGFGREDNFWGPTGKEGPCGPTAEIHYDLTGKACKLGEKCLPNCKCGRFVELWNLVFNEFYKDQEGNLSPLEQKGVDTGLGLERLAAACQGKSTVFETDLFRPFIKIIEIDSKYNYAQKPREFRIVADHIRAVTFLAAEGILPEKIGRGYILRRLLRMAVRQKRVLDGSDNLLIDLAKKAIETYKNVYPEIASKEADILTVVQKEEEGFSKALNRGLKEFEKILKSGKKRIGGEEIFHLYETYSLPPEFIKELAQEKGIEADIKGFDKAQKKHQEISRAGAEKKFGGVGITKIKNQKSKIKITKLHTATHLLQAALRQILGEELRQMGSDITEERLRFDFSFDRRLTDEEIKKVEDLVNQKIKEDLPVTKEEMSLQEALRSGALAFFKEKYPEKVTVYSINSFSKEICAGPHTGYTSELGRFKIVKQESVGSGIRRIKATLY